VALDPSLLSPGQRYVPGILGGLGPLAHIQFERALLACGHRRGARSDREHPVWLVASASSTPGRTHALLEGGESPVPHLIHYARLLERAGADALFVTCNTAHAFHGEVQRAIGIPWAHLMALVADAVRGAHPAGTAIGVLATDGTLRARLYHRELEARGLVPIAPGADSPVQAQVRAAIEAPGTGIKASGAVVTATAREQLAAAARWCAAEGARAVVLGCTEISVGLTADSFGEVPLVDPLEVAAEVLLDLAAGRREPAALYASVESR
jgi:aspartate racemase